MIKEGILPQIIENAALQLGMPLGPLQLIDEVSIELAINIAEQTKKAIGANKLMEEIEIVLFLLFSISTIYPFLLSKPFRINLSLS